MKIKYLGRCLREENAGSGFGRRKDFLNKNSVKGWNQTLCHLGSLKILVFFFSSDGEVRMRLVVLYDDGWLIGLGIKIERMIEPSRR